MGKKVDPAKGKSEIEGRFTALAGVGRPPLELTVVRPTGGVERRVGGLVCLLKIKRSPRFPAIPPRRGCGRPKQWRLVSRSIKPWVGIRRSPPCISPCRTLRTASLESGAEYAICRWLDLLHMSHFEITKTRTLICKNQTKPDNSFLSHTHKQHCLEAISSV